MTSLVGLQFVDWFRSRVHQQKGELYTLDCGDDKPTKIF